MRMINGLSVRKRRRSRLWPAHLAIVSLAALMAAGGVAEARGGGHKRSDDSDAPRKPGEPVLAVVSLRKQRINVYDSEGVILRSSVSSGQSGRETPSGIFSVIQKEVDHHSNLYDDAYMPHMQRLTWSGIALHGGNVPGYPASHGCIRLPYDFATRLYGATEMGMRVIVAPSDVEPVEIGHPLLPQTMNPDLEPTAKARVAEAAEAAKNEEQARDATAKASRDAAQATPPVRTAQSQRDRAAARLAAVEARLATVEASLSSASTADARQQADTEKSQLAGSLSDLDSKLAAAKEALQPKLDALAAARETLKNAQAAHAAADAAARHASHQLDPISVFISRKTLRLYVRRGFEPVYDTPITIIDADRPIGTHVFTATKRLNGDPSLRWNVVSLESKPQRRSPPPHEQDIAKEVLDRLVLPQDALDRISQLTPRSSLIVSDEGPSPETSKGTDFIVVLSDEPQGGIKFRKHVESSSGHHHRL